MLRRRLSALLVLAVLAQHPSVGLAQQRPNSGASRGAAGQATKSDLRRGIRIGVTDSGYDDIPSVLDALGVKYEMTAKLPDPLKELDLVFIGCRTSEGSKFPPERLRQFVERGGVVYVSDLSNDVLAPAFPEYIRSFGAGRYPTGMYECEVLDKDLIKAVGQQVTLNFEAGGWAYVSEMSDQVRVLLRSSWNGTAIPVLVGFKHGRGRVVFTSFHNHANASELEKRLIRALVEAPISAAETVREERTRTVDLKDFVDGKVPQSPVRDRPSTAINAKALDAMSADDLLSALEAADAATQERILGQLHDRKGADATTALTQAIDRVAVELQPKARDLLAKRLSRMTAATLVGYLQAQDAAELRRAAVQAATDKSDPVLNGPLIDLLVDKDTALADAAHAALVSRTGQNFGNFAGAGTVERFSVARKWQKWWADQPRD